MNDPADMEDLGNEALVFTYGHNVNIYTDVFHIAHTSSTKEIHLTYTGLLKELEVAQSALQQYDDDDEERRRYAQRLGMKDSHFALGMHPRDFLDIKMDAVKRAYDILTDKTSRKEYDDCLREFMEGFEDAPVNDVTYVSSEEEEEQEEEDDDSNDGSDSLYEASSVQVQVDSDFPLLTSHHHDNDVFDPFNLQDDLSAHQGFSSFVENNFDSMQDPVPISPDVDLAFSASFSGIHPHGHESSVKICELPSPDSDDDTSVDSADEMDNDRVFGLEPEADIHLPSQLSSDEEDELVSFQALSKSMSELDERQAAFFKQMDAGLDNIECFSEDDSDIVDNEDVDNMSISSEPNEREIDEMKEGRHVWVCLDAVMDEVVGTLDDTAVTIEQMCGMGR